MKRVISSVFIIFTAAIISNISAQQVAPPGAGDKDLRDDNIRMRSVDIERTKRDAEKPTSNSNSSSTNAPTAVIKSDIDTKYPQIKEDFEGLQNNQAAIVKAYTTGEKIDYDQIKISAAALNENAKRLDGNLFAPKVEFKTVESELKKVESKENETKAKSIKNLIVDLDTAIGNFVSSTMFQNLRVVEPEVAGNTQADLAKVMEISEMLSVEAGKIKLNEKSKQQ